MTRQTRRTFLRATGIATALGSGSGVGSILAATDEVGRSVRGSATRSVSTAAPGPSGEPFVRRFDRTVRGRLAVADSVAYFVTDDSALVAFDYARGESIWQTDVSPGSDPGVSVVDGTVYVCGSTPADQCKPGAPTLSALDAADGTVAWKHEFAAGPVTRPTVTDGTAYAVADGALFAVANGDVQWRREFDLESAAAPRVLDGTVYVRTDGSLAAADVEGTASWQLDLATGPTGSRPPLAAVDGADVAVTMDGDAVLALDETDGSTVWRRDVEGRGSLAVADGTVYARTGSHLFALGLADGTERWRAEFAANGDRLTDDLRVADGRVYFRVGHRLRAFSTADGSSAWTSRVTCDDFYVAGDTVYVVRRDRTGSSAGNRLASALDASDGSTRWQYEIPAPRGQTVLTDDALVFGDGPLTVLAGDHPQVQWRETGGPAGTTATPLAVTDDSFLVAGTEANTVYAVDRETRERRWTHALNAPVDRGMTAADGIVVAGTTDGIVGLGETDGALRWDVGTDDDAVGVATPFGHEDGTVYASLESGTDGGAAVEAFDTQTGERQWRFDGLDDGAQGLYEVEDVAVADGMVYLVDRPRDADGLVALDAATGAVRWRSTEGGTSLFGATDGYVFTDDGDSEITAHHSADGSVGWRASLSLGSFVVDLPPVSDGDSLYVPRDSAVTQEVGVDALSLDDGSVQWSRDLDGDSLFTASPALAGETVYAAVDRRVFALDPTDGSTRGRYAAKADVGGVAPRSDAVYVVDDAGHLTALRPFE